MVHVGFAGLSASGAAALSLALSYHIQSHRYCLGLLQCISNPSDSSGIYLIIFSFLPVCQQIFHTYSLLLSFFSWSYFFFLGGFLFVVSTPLLQSHLFIISV
jgi:hypothetical protein